MPRSLDTVSKVTLGKNLAEARGKHGWTQLEAARRAGVRGDRLNRWERGRETPGTEGLLLLAIAYGCPVSQLLSGVDERYDEIIEGHLPVDARRHYEAKINAFIRRTTAAMQLAIDVAAPVPTPKVSAGAVEKARGKSSRSLSRRKQTK